MSGWVPALRIARRTVLRSPARSLLIALLVAVPVAGATVVDVVARTLSAPDREAQRAIGSADAAISVTGYSRLKGSGSRAFVRARKRRDPASVDVRALLPPGSRTAPLPLEHEILIRRGEGVLRTPLTIADAREPLHHHAARLTAGRAATRADEVLISPSLAEKLALLDDGGGLRPGAAVELPDGPRAAVSGLAREQFCLSCARVMAAAGSSVAKAAAERRPGVFEYGLVGRSQRPTQLVDLPAGTSILELQGALARQGIELTGRSAFVSQRSVTLNVSSDSLRAAALVAIIVGLGLLEVILLAGTAFAVGARRQMRELGLVAANGASARDIRRIVLAQGLVLGALGAVVGVASGAAIAIAGRPLWEQFMDEAVTTWVYGRWEILAAALVGLFSGLAAAVVPAVGAARMRPVDALARRFRQVRSANRRNTIVGAALVLTGVLCGLVGDRLLAGDLAGYERALAVVATTGAYVSPPSADGPITLIVGGATLAVVGLVLLSPALIGWLSRLGPRLPLSGRLAARDAARHRHRTGPATGAITVAVAGSIVLAFLVAGVSRGDELRHVATLPAHVLFVERQGGDRQVLLRAAAGAAAELPAARRHVIQTPVGRGPEPFYLVDHARDNCRPSLKEIGQCGTTIGSGQLAVATSDGLADTVAAGRLDASARAALASGRVVVFDPVMLDDAGTVRIADGSRRARLPGHLVDRGRAYSALPSGLVGPAVVRAQGWRIRTNAVLVPFAAGADQSAIDSALDAADREGANAFEERGPSRSEGGILLVVALVSALVTLLGVAISVALSAAEGRADLATLAAVGAPPHRRRTLVASQALVIGGLGCVLGVVLGTFVAYTARAVTGAPGFVVPWGNVVATGVGVPLLAALVAALCTRSRLPLVRRAE